MASIVAIDGAWTLQSLNTAKQGRLFAGSSLQQANAVSSSVQSMGTWRTGVLATAGFLNNASGAYDLITIQESTPAMRVRVYPGIGVLSRSGQGPYVGWSSGFVDLDIATSNPTNPRIDLVIMRIIDTAIGDTGSLGAQLEVITGTPAGSPSVPATPSNAIALAKIAVAANATTIVTANITGLRVATGLLGATRPILEGDALANGGSVPGEQRYRFAAGSLPDLIDVWGIDGKWHGTRPLPAVSNKAFTSGSLTTTGAVTSIAIPDPGWAYQIIASGALAYSSGQVWQLSTAYGTPTGTIIGVGTGGTSINAYCLPEVSGTITGATTAYLVGNGSGTFSWSSGVAFNQLTVQVVPV